MKYKLKYSPEVRKKLKEIKKYIIGSAGEAVAIRIVSKIMKEIRGLQDNPQKGVSIEVMIGIHTPYRVLHVEHNYVFYRVEQEVIYVTDIYNEREDFLRQMFQMSLRTQESIDFWGE